MPDVAQRMTREQRVETIAKVCYAANKAWNDAHGVETLLWEQVRDSVCDGIERVLAGATPEQSHEAWCEYKRREGWTYGVVKDNEAKTHPCLRPYDELPEFERVKDHLFTAIIAPLAAVLGLR